MANSKIYLGNTNIGSLFQGADDISIYLGQNKVYPLEEPTFKWKASYSNGNVTSAECDSSSAITEIEIKKTNLVSVEIGDCVTSIGDYAFGYCTHMTSCTIGSGVTSIGGSAFGSCISLSSVTIPNSVTSIDGGAFYGCTSLTSIILNAVTPPTLSWGVFDNTNNCPIYVPCESVEAYKSAEEWSGYADRIACKLKFKAKYSGGETYEKVCDSSSLITTSVTKPTGYQYTAMTEAIIGDCVSTVAMNAFSGFTSLSSVTISDNVTILANQVFKDCISLTEVKLPSRINKILANTFENCTSLKNIDIPTGVTTIDGFKNCTSLENITLPNALSEIHGKAFKGCTSLKNISIPNGVTYIGDSAFYNCSGLTSITVEAITPPTLGNSAFNNTNNCPIYVPSASVEAYKTSRWWSDYASRIQAIPFILLKWFATYGSNITASAECSNNTTISSYEIPSTKGTNKDILSVTAGDCVTSIGRQAFYNYTTLSSCTIGSGVTSIGDNAFEGCKRLKSITIPDSVTSIGNYAFENCSGMTDVTIGSGVTSIGNWAFQTHTNMNSITITAPTPPTLGTTPFLNTGNCPIYVPAGSVGAYKGGTWSAYASRIQAIP